MSVENVSIVVPSSPADIQKMFALVRQLSDSKTRAKAEADYQKEAIEAAAKEFGVDAKYIKQMANDYHKDQFDKKANEFDEYSHLYETVVTRGSKLVGNTAVDVDDQDEDE
jgi:hypothetical protein